jgi:toxin ParE1/3/4
MGIKLSAEAAEEMLDAAAWYDEQEPGVGADFISACEAAFDHIAKDPLRNIQVGKGFHRYVMQRFPFLIFYEMEGELLIISAVFHSARNPAHWKRRLGLD